MKKFVLSLSSFTFAFLFEAVRKANAQISIKGIWTGLPPIFQTDVRGVDHTIISIINLSFTIAGVIALGYLIYAGFMYITGAGDRSVVEKTQKTVTHAVIGLVIIIFSYFIALLIASLVGSQGNVFVSFTNLFNSL